jgi:hypothetical protein
MDDLKLLGRNENNLKNEIKNVQTINKDINKNIGLEKCKDICLKRVKVQKKRHKESIFEKNVEELDARNAYKYFGTEESYGLRHKNEKEKMKKEYLMRMRIVLGTEISTEDKIETIGLLTVPVFRYRFGIVN